MLENKNTNVLGAGAQNCALLQSAASVAAVVGLYTWVVASLQLVPAPWVALHHLMKLMSGEFSTNKKTDFHTICSQPLKFTATAG